jgi:hypothetical protein
MSIDTAIRDAVVAAFQSEVMPLLKPVLEQMKLTANNPTKKNEPDELWDTYLAYQVQHPGEKVHWALLLEGDQGNGKSYFGTVMRLVLGPHNVRMANSEMLHGAFTGYLRNTQLIVVEEMMARGRLEVMNTLKPLITEEYCIIREMYKPHYEQPNRMNFLFFSNHKDSLILDSTDRRYCILKTLAPPHPERNKYYGPLFAWTRQNAAALAWHLEKVDLSDFSAHGHAPMTEGKRALIRQSLPELDSLIDEKVEAGEWPFRQDLVIPSEMVKPLEDFNLRVTSKAVGNAFHRLKYLQLDDRFRPDSKRQDLKMPLWAVRNFGNYKDLTTYQLRQCIAVQNIASASRKIAPPPSNIASASGKIAPPPSNSASTSGKSTPGAGTNNGTGGAVNDDDFELQAEVSADTLSTTEALKHSRPANPLMSCKGVNPVKDQRPM